MPAPILPPAPHRGNSINGVAIIAVPILDPEDHMSQAIVVVGLTEQINNSTAIAIAQDMRNTARTIEEQLFSY
jgi:DNA-binding IclR family transcriptional regulator